MDTGDVYRLISEAKDKLIIVRADNTQTLNSHEYQTTLDTAINELKLLSLDLLLVLDGQEPFHCRQRMYNVRSGG